jgi:signal transduction histidine kinase
LVFTIFKLYQEAEKVQKSIFVNEVFLAGEEVVNQINVILQGKADTLNFLISQKKTEDTVKNINSPAIYQQINRKFLIDSSNHIPNGIIKITNIYKYDNLYSQTFDTTYFDTNYRKIFPYSESALDLSYHQKFDVGKIEMDSASIRLLNPELLNQIIRKTLSGVIVKYNYDFAIYNAFTTQFVILPQKTSAEKILKSNYVFTLKLSDKFSAPHYLILYFPEEKFIYMRLNSPIIISMALLLTIILSVSSVMLYLFNREKKNTIVKNDFINNITHEFKTPLSTIALACEALRDETFEKDRDTTISYISIIQDENERLKMMVSNILQLAQLRKGQLKMNISKINIHHIIKAVADSVALQVSSKQGILVMNLNAKNPYMYADGIHITNCIINLIENAVKYTKNHPEIVIETQNNKETLIVSVQDNGIGIAPKNIKKIFQEFYRISSGNIHDAKGFGMGLDYVKKIVSLHNGNITVKSELNKGTIFTLFLPSKKLKHGKSEPH